MQQFTCLLIYVYRFRIHQSAKWKVRCVRLQYSTKQPTKCKRHTSTDCVLAVNYQSSVRVQINLFLRKPNPVFSEFHWVTVISY